MFTSLVWMHAAAVLTAHLPQGSQIKLSHSMDIKELEGTLHVLLWCPVWQLICSCTVPQCTWWGNLLPHRTIKDTSVKAKVRVLEHEPSRLRFQDLLTRRMAAKFLSHYYYYYYRSAKSLKLELW